MVVHPSAGHYSGTLVNAIMYHCKDSLSGINGQIRPGIVHRIDMDTTGSLIVCKNDESHVNIAEQIKEHTVNRIYVGIVCGNVTEDEGTIEGAIEGIRLTAKMAVNEKTENRQLLIIKFLNVLEIILICSFNWKPDELTRSVYTWQASGIRYSEILCIPVADHRSNICRGRRSTQKQ